MIYIYIYIYHPKTYAASCKLGHGTRWCTATTSKNHHYKEYTASGKLFIFINKETSEPEYQFHFNEKDWEISFMDKLDRRVDIKEFILSYPDFKKFLTAALSPILNGEKMGYPILIDHRWVRHHTNHISQDDLNNDSEYYGLSSYKVISEIKNARLPQFILDKLEKLNMSNEEYLEAIDNKKHYLHRLIMRACEDSLDDIDHIEDSNHNIAWKGHKDDDIITITSWIVVLRNTEYTYIEGPMFNENKYFENLNEYLDYLL